MDIDKVALDRWITGNYGEDQFPPHTHECTEANDKSATEICICEEYEGD